MVEMENLKESLQKIRVSKKQKQKIKTKNHK